MKAVGILGLVVALAVAGCDNDGVAGDDYAGQGLFAVEGALTTGADSVDVDAIASPRIGLLWARGGGAGLGYAPAALSTEFPARFVLALTSVPKDEDLLLTSLSDLGEVPDELVAPDDLRFAIAFVFAFDDRDGDGQYEGAEHIRCATDPEDLLFEGGLGTCSFPEDGEPVLGFLDTHAVLYVAFDRAAVAAEECESAPWRYEETCVEECTGDTCAEERCEVTEGTKEHHTCLFRLGDDDTLDFSPRMHAGFSMQYEPDSRCETPPDCEAYRNLSTSEVELLGYQFEGFRLGYNLVRQQPCGEKRLTAVPDAERVTIRLGSVAPESLPDCPEEED